MLTAKQVQKITGCGPQFIPALTKKFNKQDPVWMPKHKAKQGETSLYTFDEALMVGCLWEARQLGLPRKYARKILKEIEQDYIVIEFYTQNCVFQIAHRKIREKLITKAKKLKIKI